MRKLITNEVEYVGGTQPPIGNANPTPGYAGEWRVIMEHSKLPWTMEAYPDADLAKCFVVRDSSGKAINLNQANAEYIVKTANVLPMHIGLLKWLGDIVLTASDGGDAWCALREQPGAEQWREDLKIALESANELP